MPHIAGIRAGSLNASVPLRHTCNTGTAAFSPQTLQLQARFTSQQEALENIPQAGRSSVAPWRVPLAAAGCTARAAAAAADGRGAGAGERAGGSSWLGGTWQATVGVPGPSAPLGNEQRCSQGGRRMGMARGLRIAQGNCRYPSPRVWGMPNTGLCRNATRNAERKGCHPPLGSPTPTTPWVLGPSDLLCSLHTLGLTVPG